MFHRRRSQRQLERRYTSAGLPDSPCTTRAYAWRIVAVPALLGLFGACHRPGLPDPSISAADSLIGSWSVESRDEGGTAYSGTLAVARYDGGGVYSGDLQMGFKGPDGADIAVAENAKITVDGAKVLVQCSKAVVLTENGDYNADNFLLTRQGQDVLKGLAKDSHSVAGTITLTRTHHP